MNIQRGIASRAFPTFWNCVIPETIIILESNLGTETEQNGEKEKVGGLEH